MKYKEEIREALSGPIPSISTPFLENGGFDVGIRATMEVFGISKGLRRKPFISHDADDVASMREFFEQLELI